MWRNGPVKIKVRDLAPRGCLRLAPLAAALAATVALASCGEKSQAPLAQMTAPEIAKPAPPSTPDPRAVYELRERCGKDAQAWFHHYYEENVSKVPGYSLINSSFTSHYNERMNMCFAVVNSLTSVHDDKTNASKLFDSRSLADVLENKDRGTFAKFSDMNAPMGCSVDGKNCASAQEWEGLTKPFMEQ
jgi:hypothetical protein